MPFTNDFSHAPGNPASYDLKSQLPPQRATTIVCTPARSPLVGGERGAAHFTFTETIMQVQPYVFFNGRCEEALTYYGKHLGAEVTFMMRFKDAPPDPQNPPRAGLEDKIMHANVKLGASQWMASDGHCDPDAPPMSGFSLSLTVEDPASAQQYFNALADGGQVLMPWGATFWSKGFGMTVDRFGLTWMVTLPPQV
ncbi:PhnB protein [Paraburkholderia terricola]|uniref:PhnB protein n=2 Tax=Paraburkholderia terricola TaxID=169427 RepID=A0A1M6QBH9_9BURK|nr:PhnB protein [Paraburkholderia sediminicola]SHK17592.1 PhnB protein [Paraburkholderia terricola]